MSESGGLYHTIQDGVVCTNTFSAPFPRAQGEHAPIIQTNDSSSYQ